MGRGLQPIVVNSLCKLHKQLRGRQSLSVNLIYQVMYHVAPPEQNSRVVQADPVRADQVWVDRNRRYDTIVPAEFFEEARAALHDLDAGDEGGEIDADMDVVHQFPALEEREEVGSQALDSNMNADESCEEEDEEELGYMSDDGFIAAG